MVSDVHGMILSGDDVGVMVIQDMRVNAIMRMVKEKNPLVSTVLYVARNVYVDVDGILNKLREFQEDGNQFDEDGMRTKDGNERNGMEVHKRDETNGIPGLKPNGIEYVHKQDGDVHGKPIKPQKFDQLVDDGVFVLWANGRSGGPLVTVRNDRVESKRSNTWFRPLSVAGLQSPEQVLAVHEAWKKFPKVKAGESRIHYYCQRGDETITENAVVIEACKQLNPNHKHVIWTTDSVKHAFGFIPSERNLPFLLLGLQGGGIFVNVDYICLKPFEFVFRSADDDVKSQNQRGGFRTIENSVIGMPRFSPHVKQAFITLDVNLGNALMAHYVTIQTHSPRHYPMSVMAPYQPSHWVIPERFKSSPFAIRLGKYAQDHYFSMTSAVPFERLRFAVALPLGPAGICNRVMTMLSTFLVAVLTGRTFFLDWEAFAPQKWDAVEKAHGLAAYEDIFGQPPIYLKLSNAARVFNMTVKGMRVGGQKYYPDDERWLEYARQTDLDAKYKHLGLFITRWDWWAPVLFENPEYKAILRDTSPDEAFQLMFHFIFPAWEVIPRMSCNTMIQIRRSWSRPVATFNKFVECASTKAGYGTGDVSYLVTDSPADEEAALTRSKLIPFYQKYNRSGTGTADRDTVKAMYTLSQCENAVLTTSSSFGSCIAGLGRIRNTFEVRPDGSCVKRRADPLGAGYTLYAGEPSIVTNIINKNVKATKLSAIVMVIHYASPTEFGLENLNRLVKGLHSVYDHALMQFGRPVFLFIPKGSMALLRFLKFEIPYHVDLVELQNDRELLFLFRHPALRGIDAFLKLEFDFMTTSKWHGDLLKDVADKATDVGLWIRDNFTNKLATDCYDEAGFVNAFRDYINNVNVVSISSDALVLFETKVAAGKLDTRAIVLNRAFFDDAKFEKLVDWFVSKGLIDFDVIGGPKSNYLGHRNNLIYALYSFMGVLEFGSKSMRTSLLYYTFADNIK